MTTSGDDEKTARQRVLQLVIAEQRRRICSTRAVRIVEQYSTENVTRHFLCKTLGLIERSHWDDAVDERNGEGLCGYVLCSSRPLMDAGKQQQYRICSRTNRVYNMDEYNRFCSVQCYKRSNHIKEQIPDSPVVSRNHLMTVNVELLEDKETEETTPNPAERTREQPSSPDMVDTTTEPKASDEESQSQPRSGGRRGKKPFSYSKTKLSAGESERVSLMEAKDAVKSWITDETIKWLNNELVLNKSEAGEEGDAYKEKVEKFYGRRSRRNDDKEAEKDEDADRIFIPLVDSVSQDGVRRRIVLEKLSPCLQRLLPEMKVALNVVTPALRSMMNTFALSATNIVLRPGQWNVVALLLLKLLAKREEEIRIALSSSDSKRVFEQTIGDNPEFIVEEMLGNDFFSVD